MKEYRFRTPLKEEDVRCLQVGDVVYLSGTIHTSRDMAHLKYKTLIKEGQPLPRNFAGSVIFHAGPVCLKQSDGSWKLSLIGPTTSIRMEPYADMVGQMGVKAIIGKGGMGRSTCDACQTYGYVYLQAAPGCAAKLSTGIRRVCQVTYLEFGMPEALWTLDAVEFGPLVVGIDCHGNSLYAQLKERASDIAAKLYPES